MSTRCITDDADDTERLGPDDMATRREGEFLSAALQQQRHQAQAAGAVQRGVCAFCSGACQPLAVYCDESCRDDHAQRQRVLRRQGRGG